MLSLGPTRLALAVATATLLCGGCASADLQQGKWVKAGVSAEQQGRDQDECKQSAAAKPERTAALYEECMRTRGYELARYERPDRPHRVDRPSSPD